MIKKEMSVPNPVRARTSLDFADSREQRILDKFSQHPLMQNLTQ